jgi:S-adenosylmethionine synthetase
LRNPIFAESAAYGHMGRQPGSKEVQGLDGATRTVETFTWEKLDYVDKIKAEFGL